MYNKPWLNEPDILMYDSNGYECLIRRAPIIGHLCGYVGVKKDHPLFGVDYNSSSDAIDIHVHGGVTFTGIFENINPDIWWIGFDCAHFWDLTPQDYKLGHCLNSYTVLGERTYKDINFVKEEIETMIEQIDEMYNYTHIRD